MLDFCSRNKRRNLFNKYCSLCDFKIVNRGALLLSGVVASHSCTAGMLLGTVRQALQIQLLYK
jgi:hypothetical protein